MADVPSKWKDRLGQEHCQYETFAKLRTSCPCEVELEMVLFFFERDWHVHKKAVWECFDLGTWTHHISSHVLAHWSMKRKGHRMSATCIGSREKFCKRNRMSVCAARKRKASILSFSYTLNRLNRCSRWRTRPLQMLCHNMVHIWYVPGKPECRHWWRWRKMRWPTPGTGVGLYSCRHDMPDHGGSSRSTGVASSSCDLPWRSAAMPWAPGRRRSRDTWRPTARCAYRP